MGIARACRALGMSRSTLYYQRRPPDPPKPVAEPRKPPRHAISEAERQQVLDALNSERFMDKSPTEVYATLLDERTYLCSTRTMYRILAANSEVKERRNILRHPAYSKPELIAEAPNQVWSWDITKLRGPVKWTYYYLYVILDIYSRYVVGWMIADRESGDLAKQLIEATCEKHGVDTTKLIIHSDRGSSMTSQVVGNLLADLGITKSHSRPYTSDDNPFSESQFKTMKYRPEFPERFGSAQDARAFCRSFFAWYNNEHHHSGIALLTPAQVHYGKAEEVLAARHQVLLEAYRTYPERFIKPPAPQPLPNAVWINPPPDVPTTTYSK